jgi:hypothetical protein
MEAEALLAKPIQDNQKLLELSNRELPGPAFTQFFH